MGNTNPDRRAQGRSPSGKYSYGIALVGLGAAFLLAILANVAFVADRSPLFGLAGWLWLAGIGMLVVSCATWPRTAGRGADAAAERWPRWERAAFVGLVALAVVFRLWDLNNIPYNIYGDEIVMGRVAMDSYIAIPGPSVFTLLWRTIDLPGLWFLAVAKSLELGGSTLWSLRLTSALFGAAAVIPFYGFVRLGWGRAAAIAGTAIFAFSAVAVHYSRLSINNIVTPFFWATCFFFLLRGLQHKRPLDWALAGLAGGLSEYAYYGTRLLPFILVAFSGYLLATNWRMWREYLGQLTLVGMGYVVGFGPLLARYVAHPELYTGRAQGLLSWDHIPVDWNDIGRMLGTLWPIVQENLLGISTHSSQDDIYFAPLLLPAEAALLALGITLMIMCWRRHPASFLALVMMVGVVLTGGTLVVYGAAPTLNHWTPAFPAIYAALAAPVGAWLSQVSSVGGRWRVIAPVLLAAGIAVMGLLNYNFYFREYFANPDTIRLESYRTAQEYLEVRSAQAHYQADLGPRYMVRIIGDAEYLDNPDLPYLAQGQDYAPLTDPAKLSVAHPPGKGLAFLFMPGGEQYRDLVHQQYPGGEDGEVLSRTGRHLFYTYVLAPVK